jgi:hypothetical protein
MRFETEDLKRIDAASKAAKRIWSEWICSTLFVAIEG